MNSLMTYACGDEELCFGRNYTGMEFVPVVLAAGQGSRMQQLTSQCPKALLTVGNFPMVYYPLRMLERQGFPEAIVVVPRTYGEEFQTTLLNICGIKMRLDFVEVPEQEDWGTAQSLRLIRSKIPESSSVLLLGCDLISDINLNAVLNVFRSKDASAVVLLNRPKESQDQAAPGPKSKKGEDSRGDRSVFGLAGEDGRILIMKSMRNNPKPKDEFVDPKIFDYSGCIDIQSVLNDCHLYVLKRWVLDYLTVHKDCEKMTSIKYDLLPHLVKKQFVSERRLRKSRSTWQKTTTEDDASDGPSITQRLADISLNSEHDVYAFAEITASQKVSCKTLNLAKYMSGACGFVRGAGEEHDLDQFLNMPGNTDIIRCYSVIQEEGFCFCTNSLPTFCEANRQISKVMPLFAPKLKSLIDPAATLKKTAQVGPDCIVGDQATLGEKVSVKKSVVGCNSTIKDKAKIANSIIMDKVTIGESCSLFNCVICTGTTVGEMSELKDTIVTQSMTLPPSSKSSNEVITDMDRTFE